MKKTEVAEVPRKSKKIGLGGQKSKSAAPDRAMAMGSNRVVLGPRPKGVADRGGDEEEMADVDEEEEAAEVARDGLALGWLYGLAFG
jgi:hypothetical protein